ncbi:MAG TPA: hypothetical protein VHP63_06115, partial [candidate division Zixibacteria bacterium]|nr:hypothetical protein [candidate division Zixibacteria bacterium]
YGALAGEVITAEIILYPNGDILLQYLTVAAGFDIANSTIGLENADGSDGIQVAYLTPYVTNNLAVKFSIPYQWVTLNKFSGALLASEKDTVKAKFASGELADGDYNANIVISSTDPNGTRNPWVVPAQLTVTDAVPFVCGDFDGNGALQNIVDLNYWVNFVFRGGPTCPDLRAADLDGNGTVQNIVELNYMVNYIFRGGPAPLCQ